MCCRRRPQVGATNHVGDVLVGVVHHHCQVVSPMAVRALQHKISHRSASHTGKSAASVFPTLHVFGHVKPPGPRLLTRRQARLARARIQAIHRCQCQVFAGADAPECVSVTFQRFQRLGIQGVPVALVNHLSIPRQTKRVEGAKDVVGRPRHFPWRVQIFHAKQPSPTLGPGVKPTGQSRDHGSHVQPPRR